MVFRLPANDDQLIVAFEISLPSLIKKPKKTQSWTSLGLISGSAHEHYLGCVARKPLFGVSNQVRLKPVSSAS